MTEFCNEFVMNLRFFLRKNIIKSQTFLWYYYVIKRTKELRLKNWNWYLNNINSGEKLDVRLKFLEIYDVIVKMYLILEIYNLSY